MRKLTLAKAIAPFEKVRRNLQALLTQNEKRLTKINSRRAKLKLEELDLSAENAKTQEVLNKLTELLGE